MQSVCWCFCTNSYSADSHTLSLYMQEIYLYDHTRVTDPLIITPVLFPYQFSWYYDWFLFLGYSYLSYQYLLVYISESFRGFISLQLTSITNGFGPLIPYNYLVIQTFPHPSPVYPPSLPDGSWPSFPPVFILCLIENGFNCHLVRFYLFNIPVRVSLQTLLCMTCQMVLVN